MRKSFLFTIAMLGLSSVVHAAIPQIITAKADSAGAVLINWRSTSNVVYRIDFATNLADGGNQWQTVYEDYPSHGTNTIWKDAGNQTGFIRVPHPNDSAKRFYRLIVTGTNANSRPRLGIVSPAAGSTLRDSVTVSVAVTSSLSVASIRLFVDGQEAGNQLYPETNFVINTAQFGNGPHKLFAVAENFDGAETTLEPSNLVNNFAASPYHNVTFNNFISDFRGSAVFVEPNDGETLTFKANFAAYADWTLVISNSSAAAVRNVSGTGYKMTFVWDGKDDSSNDLPADFYSPTLSATTSTNTPPTPVPSPSTNPPPPSANGASAWFPTDWAGALMRGWDHYFAPPPPLPPPLAEELGPQPWIAVPVPGQKESFSNANDQPASGEGRAAAAGGGTLTLIPPRLIHNLGTMALAYQPLQPSHFPKSSRDL